MADVPLRSVIRQLQRVVGSQGGAWSLSDAQLLEAFIDHRDRAAVEILVWRHGTMVLNVCRRILHDEHLAEDAFQAAFLVFVRKAGVDWQAPVRRQLAVQSSVSRRPWAAGHLGEAAEQWAGEEFR